MDEFMELADKVAAFINERDWVSQREIMNEFEGMEGNLHMVFRNWNVVPFVGCSDLFLDLVDQFICRTKENHSRVYLAPTEYLVYLIDGCPIPVGMPLTYRLPNKPYKKERFFSDGVSTIEDAAEGHQNESVIWKK